MRPSAKQRQVTEDTSEYEVLCHLLYGRFGTDTEKYDALCVRDRLLRNKYKTRFAYDEFSSPIVGTCEDMCPELERYRRTLSGAVSPFEKIPDNTALPHRNLMVKEYVRSSADQEAPLPHEVRTVQALKHSVNYLCSLANKASLDKLEVSLYNFICDRLRAIRKDICQQCLHDLDCARILEICVQFHVFSIVEFCGEDSEVFDPKLNEINLGKALGALLDLYEHLSRNNMRSQYEMDFKSYSILLNPQECQLRNFAFTQDDLKSEPMQFAVQVVYAVQTNNYVRYFRLLENAPFFVSCMMSRFISPMRIMAFKVMAKAYSLPSRAAMIPLHNLKNSLKFLNIDEVKEFCNCLGLEVVHERVKLDRNVLNKAEVIPRIPTPLLVDLVRKKCTVPIGDLLSGGHIEITYMDLSCSFNSDGTFKREYLYELLQNAEFHLKSRKIQGLPTPRLGSKVPSSKSFFEHVIVPSGFIGSLVGYKGCRIRQLEYSCSVQIDIVDEKLKTGEQKIVIIKGKEATVRGAVEIIKNHIHKLSSRRQGGRSRANSWSQVSSQKGLQRTMHHDEVGHKRRRSFTC